MFSAVPGVCGLVLLLIAGCQSYSPYGYGGYPAGGGYGPTMGGPAGGTTYITPGSVPGSPVMPGQPIASPPPTIGGGGGTSPIGGRPSLSPTSDPGGKQVPNYNDPNDPAATSPSASRPRDLEIHDEADFQGPMKEKNKLDELKNDSEDDFGSSMNDRRLDDGFADPMPVQTASFAERAPAVANDSRLSPYAHKADFSWVRGIADYDAASSSWYVVYNPEPDAQDPYSGSLTLAPHAKLDTVHPNEVVLVMGRVDEAHLDRFGKPTYAISNLQRLRAPKAAAPTGP
jgi:hypothetical protein